jgi:hypothetical protein
LKMEEAIFAHILVVTLVLRSPLLPYLSRWVRADVGNVRHVYELAEPQEHHANHKSIIHVYEVAEPQEHHPIVRCKLNYAVQKHSRVCEQLAAPRSRQLKHITTTHH